MAGDVIMSRDRVDGEYQGTSDGGLGGRSGISPRNQCGFSLIEAMIAMVILTVGCLAVVGMFVIADRAAAHSAKWDQAAMLARQLMEWKRALPFDQLRQDDRDGDGVADGEMGPAAGDRFMSEDDPGAFHRQWELRLDHPAAGLATVSVMIDWQDDGRSQRFALGMVRADPRAGS
jgi:hypothetical protein